jgi:hypothetical protein
MEEIYDEIHRKYPETTFSIVLTQSKILFFDKNALPVVEVEIKTNGFNLFLSLFEYKNKLKMPQ